MSFNVVFWLVVYLIGYGFTALYMATKKDKDPNPVTLFFWPIYWLCYRLPIFIGWLTDISGQEPLLYADEKESVDRAKFEKKQAEILKPYPETKYRKLITREEFNKGRPTYGTEYWSEKDNYDKVYVEGVTRFVRIDNPPLFEVGKTYKFKDPQHGEATIVAVKKYDKATFYKYARKMVVKCPCCGPVASLSDPIADYSMPLSEDVVFLEGQQYNSYTYTFTMSDGKREATQGELWLASYLEVDINREAISDVLWLELPKAIKEIPY